MSSNLPLGLNQTAISFDDLQNAMPSESFLVCGLGSLGQYCVEALKEFNVRVTGIDLIPDQHWEVTNFLELLDKRIVGDCRQVAVLEQAEIQFCRAALLVTSEERVNAETALVIRRLNPQTRLVVRSAKENLNQLLSQQLGNFVAFEPTQLPSSAFALAALGENTLGFFNLDHQQMRVTRRTLEIDDRLAQRPLQDLNHRTRRILCHLRQADQSSLVLYDWEPRTRPQAGDQIIYIETVERSLSDETGSLRQQRSHRWQQWNKYLRWEFIKQQLISFWQRGEERPLRRAVVVYGLIVIALLVVGTILFHSSYPDINLQNAFYGVAILLLGGYGDLFGDLSASGGAPGWLKLMALMYTLAGTALVGVRYALLTQALLSSRFQFVARRPPVPANNHTVVVGLGRVGQKVVTLLQDFNQSIVGVTANSQFDTTLLPAIPLVMKNFEEALAEVNLRTAKSVVIVTDDEMLNLETGLMARSLNPSCNLVIRTLDRYSGQRWSQLLPHSSILCAYSVAAEAFAGAAFGENILSLFRIGHQTILVTEYQIESGDTLHNRVLGEVAYGYSVVPILHQSPRGKPKILPSDETLLEAGDRLVVLATINGLRAVEQGLKITQPTWRVNVEQALTSDAAFEGANLIVRVSGCSLNIARNLMNDLPADLPFLLYKHQAFRLVKELRRSQVIAQVLGEEETDGH
ncbi:MAG: potassium channel family protein [Microcoleaceae cyanobacterium]